MIDHFGLLAPLYDRLIPATDPAHLRERLRLPAAGRLLDAGGGTGRASAALAPLTDRIVISDISLALFETLALMHSHFHTARDISALVASYGQSAQVERDGQFAAWIIVDKQP